MQETAWQTTRLECKLGCNRVRRQFSMERRHHNMAPDILEKFLFDSSAYLGQQAKAASLSPPQKLARPEGSRSHSRNGSLPPPISRRRFDPIRRTSSVSTDPEPPIQPNDGATARSTAGLPNNCRT